MTKSDLILKIYERYPELGRHLIEDAVCLFFSEIAGALQKGRRVELRGFGSFSVRKRASRVGRNPKTGTVVKVQEKCSPFFKAGKELKEIINRPHSQSFIRTRPEKMTPGFHTPQHSVR